MPDITYFSTVQTSRLCGLKPTMLDYLCRQGIFMPSCGGAPGRGKPRKYSFGDIVLLKALCILLNNGISVQRLKKALKTLRRKFPEITETTQPEKYLITDGKNIYYHSKPNGFIDLTSDGQLAFGFVIEVSSIRKSLREKARKLKAA